MATSRNERLEPLYEELTQHAAQKRRYTQVLWDERLKLEKENQNAATRYYDQMTAKEAGDKKNWLNLANKGGAVAGPWGWLAGATIGQFQATGQRMKEGQNPFTAHYRTVLDSPMGNIGTGFESNFRGEGFAKGLKHKDSFVGFTPENSMGLLGTAQKGRTERQQRVAREGAASSGERMFELSTRRNGSGNTEYIPSYNPEMDPLENTSWEKDYELGSGKAALRKPY